MKNARHIQTQVEPHSSSNEVQWRAHVQRSCMQVLAIAGEVDPTASFALVKNGELDREPLAGRHEHLEH